MKITAEGKYVYVFIRNSIGQCKSFPQNPYLKFHSEKRFLFPQCLKVFCWFNGKKHHGNHVALQTACQRCTVPTILSVKCSASIPEMAIFSPFFFSFSLFPKIFYSLIHRSLFLIYLFKIIMIGINTNPELMLISVNWWRRFHNLL